MTEIEINHDLDKRGIIKSDIVRHFREEHPHLSPNYANTLIRGIISGSKWSDDAAAWLKKNYKIQADKPAFAMSKRERLRVAA